jgi:hypothetical protein
MVAVVKRGHLGQKVMMVVAGLMDHPDHSDQKEKKVVAGLMDHLDHLEKKVI